jgi:hypothetical protein
MARKSRLDAPGALHHIIVRGIERRSIFFDGRDYQNFLERLGHFLTASATRCHAWALMKNHLHLLLRRINKKHLSVVALKDVEDENKYWHGMGAIERLEAIEIQRRMVYGKDRVSSRLQRLLETAELSRG